MLTLAFLLAASSGAPLRAATELGIGEASFTINGKPAFLVGMSMYGAVGEEEEPLRRDLEELLRSGFNWIRVWATWNAYSRDVSAVDAAGAPREMYLERLRRLVAECDRLGMVVDVTLCRGKGAGPGRIEDLPAHRRAVETLTGALKHLPNWFLDLSNERNIGDARFTSFEDLAELRDLVRKLDPRRLVTASQGGDIGKDELKKYLERAKVDFVTPHRPRHARTASETEEQSREYLRWMGEIGRRVPLLYQEPFRRGYSGWEPRAADYLEDLRGAKVGGAAGWCLHNGGQKTAADERPRRSFDLTEKRLFDQLDAEEKEAIVKIAAYLKDSAGAGK